MATATTDATRTHAFSIISLTIAIDDVRYAVDAIDPGEFGVKAFRLTKRAADRAVYDVLLGHDGLIECSCPDYEFRHRNTAEACKHGAALAFLGLLPVPAAKGTNSACTPAPCCHAGEPRPCMACVPALATTDAATSLLDAGIAIARDEAINPPLDLPDRYEDEAPVLDLEADFDPADLFPPDEADAWDAELPVELWPEDTDADAWELGPAPDPAPSLALDQLIDRQADAFRAWPVDAGKLLAETLEALAVKVRLTESITPDDYRPRVEVLEQDVRHQWMDAGYETGRDVGRRECPAGSAFGHSA